MERWVHVFICGSLVTTWPGSAQAGTCALCRQALASGGNQGLIQGFYWSTLLIAGVPLVIIGTVGLLVLRRARLKKGIDERRHPPSPALQG